MKQKIKNKLKELEHKIVKNAADGNFEKADKLLKEKIKLIKKLAKLNGWKNS